MAEPSAPNATPSGQTFYPDGRPVPASELPKAAASGSARWKPGEKVPFLSPDGSGYLIPSEEAQSRIGAGWTPVAPEDFERLKSAHTPASVAEVLGGTALGVGRAATLGTIDAVLPRETTERLEQAAPIATGLGEIAGTAATMGGSALERGGVAAAEGLLARTPAGLVSRGAEAAGSALASRLPGGVPVLRAATQAATAGAIEGGAYAAGQELARVAQGDEGFNAEVFASQVGRGALTGAAFGGGLGTAAGLASKGVGGLKSAYRELAEAAAETEGVTAERLTRAQKQTAKAAGITDFKKAGVERVRVMTQDMLDTGIIAKEGPLAAGARGDMATIASRVEARQSKIGKEVGSVYKDADGLASLGTPDGNAFVDTTRLSRTKIDPVSGKKVVVGDRLQSLAGTAGLTRKQELLAPLQEYIGELRKRGGSKYEGVAGQLESSWIEPISKAESFEDLHRLVSDIQAETRGTNVDKIYGEAATEFASKLKLSLRDSLASVDPLLHTKLKKLDELYSAYAQLSPQSINAAAQAQKVQKDLTPFDLAMLAAGAASGNPAMLAFGGAKAVARLSQESTRLAAAKARFFEGANAAVSKERIQLFDALSDAASHAAIKVPQATGKLAAMAQSEGYAEKAREAREAVLTPEKTSAALQRSLAPLAAADAPRAAAVAAIRLGDLQWLSDYLGPKANLGTQAFEMIGKSPVIDVPPSVAASFLRASQALQDPTAELKGVRDGNPVSSELATVIRERRPKLREVLENEFDRLSAELAEDGKAMSYETRITASVLTGKPYDVTMKPEMVSFVQKTWAGSGAPVAPSLPQPGEGSGRRPTRPQRERLGRFRTTAEDVMDYSHE